MRSVITKSMIMRSAGRIMMSGIMRIMITRSESKIMRSDAKERDNEEQDYME